jgi:hypothetical protein
MTRTRSSRTSKKRPSGRLRTWLGWGLKLGLVGLVILGGFAVYLDAVVQEKFSGKRWTIPAKVYARPLELFVGQKLAKNDFLTELDALGYRRQTTIDGPGTDSVNGNTVDLNTRGFQFYEGLEQPQAVRVKFSGDYVSELSGSGGKKVAVVRLEPLLIGGLYPKNLEDRILIKLDQVPPQALRWSNDGEQRLVVLNRLTVFYQDRFDHTAGFSFDVVHHFHCFDDAQGIAFLHGLAHFDECRRSWRRLAVEGADHRRARHGAVELGSGRFGSSNGGGGDRRCSRSGHWRRCIVLLGWRLAVAADPYGFFAFLDFQLVDAGLFQQLDQFLDFTNIH